LAAAVAGCRSNGQTNRQTDGQRERQTFVEDIFGPLSVQPAAAAAAATCNSSSFVQLSENFA